MSVPLIVISTFKVKEGQLEALKQYYEEGLGLFNTKEPRMIAFHGFLSEDGQEMTSIQVHPDTASMEFHMQVLAENWEYFKDYGHMLEPVRIEYFGTPPASSLAMDEDLDINQQRLRLKPVHIAGFTRSAAG